MKTRIGEELKGIKWERPKVKGLWIMPNEPLLWWNPISWWRRYKDRTWYLCQSHNLCYFVYSKCESKTMALFMIRYVEKEEMEKRDEYKTNPCETPFSNPHMN